MNTVNVYREYFLDGKKKVCSAEVVEKNDDVISVKMPIGDIYKFSVATKKVIGNSQLLTIGAQS